MSQLVRSWQFGLALRLLLALISARLWTWAIGWEFWPYFIITLIVTLISWAITSRRDT